MDVRVGREEGSGARECGWSEEGRLFFCVCVFVCVNLSANLSVCLCMSLSVYLSIYLWFYSEASLLKIRHEFRDAE